jgi:hypothetical protein
MIRAVFLFLCFLLTVLASCSQLTAPGTLLYFVEREPGGEPYRTRMIVTVGFLRIDGGAGSKDFLLFDRADGTIYNVSSADKQILVIGHRLMLPAPPDLKSKVAPDDQQVPSVGEHKVRHYRLLTNEKLCYDLYAAEGLLPEAVLALREYREALAGEQAVTVPALPKGMQSPCDLANNVYLPARHLAHGFPVRYADMTGRTSELVDYADYRAEAAVFQLPKNYRRMLIEDLRGKK